MYDHTRVPPLYTEADAAGNGYRETYLRGMEALVEARRAQANTERAAFSQNIARDREAYRKKYLDMLGWPLNAPAEPVRGAKTTPVAREKDMEIDRVQLEVFPGFFFYGIWFRHTNGQDRPLVISQHGGGGTPELASSFFDCVNYNDMTVRLFRRGADVFAPQLLLWNENRFGPANRRQEMDNSLKQLGGSVTALEIYCILRCVDALSSRYARVGMAGLSYGGFYTLYTAAADARISSALTCACFNDRIAYNWRDMVWRGSAQTFLDAEVGALICPRRLVISVGDADELFRLDLARAEFARLQPLYAESPGQLFFCPFEGTHEFCPGEEELNLFFEPLA